MGRWQAPHCGGVVVRSRCIVERARHDRRLGAGFRVAVLTRHRRERLGRGWRHVARHARLGGRRRVRRVLLDVARRRQDVLASGARLVRNVAPGGAGQHASGIGPPSLQRRHPRHGFPQRLLALARRGRLHRPDRRCEGRLSSRLAGLTQRHVPASDRADRASLGRPVRGGHGHRDAPSGHRPRPEPVRRREARARGPGSYPQHHG